MLATVESSYGCDAEFYDRRTGAFQSDRLRIIDALPLRVGDVVLDVGCGTGLCFEGLRDRVGGSGVVIGIDQAPKMVSLSAERIARHGWDNVTIVQAPVESAPIPVMADAALFCAVHDVLQSPAALANVFDHLRPGAWVAAGGGKYHDLRHRHEALVQGVENAAGVRPVEAPARRAHVPVRQVVDELGDGANRPSSCRSPPSAVGHCCHSRREPRADPGVEVRLLAGLLDLGQGSRRARRTRTCSRA